MAIHSTSCMTLTFIQAHRVTRKPELLQSISHQALNPDKFCLLLKNLDELKLIVLFYFDKAIVQGE